MEKIIILVLLALRCSCSNATQIDNLYRLLKSKRAQKSPDSVSWIDLHEKQEYSPVYIAHQDGLMDADKIDKLPGQPDNVDFNQYSGYVTVDPQAGRALFYYFVESPPNSSTNPLVLWLNGGPGCTSFGFGAMEELGPFRVNSDGRTLFRNNYAWNNVANVIFLESPAGVGFSYSNTTSDYNNTGDSRTAKDAYVCLSIGLRDSHNTKLGTFTSLEKVMLAITYLNLHILFCKIGNALIDDITTNEGRFDFAWSHALISDDSHEGLIEFCVNGNSSNAGECEKYLDKASNEIGDIYGNNIYAPLCLNPVLKNGSGGSLGVRLWEFHLVLANVAMDEKLAEVMRKFDLSSIEDEGARGKKGLEEMQFQGWLRSNGGRTSPTKGGNPDRQEIDKSLGKKGSEEPREEKSRARKTVASKVMIGMCERIERIKGKVENGALVELVESDNANRMKDDDISMGHNPNLKAKEENGQISEMQEQPGGSSMVLKREKERPEGD
ncbi:hypothetical protein ACH5RR_009475 [Cinchona calisaya]|uniref:Uncharacterized protein n=1 Tax=Cinchona calisaya TaxID=153742 RepID=A0ABD3AGA1_9GENT